MNRTVLIGGVAAVVVLLGTAGYLIFVGRHSGGPGGASGVEGQGPESLNQVAVVTDHTSNLSQDGKRLTIAFPAFELVAKPGETTSAVFSTTWHVKAAPDDRVVVATSTLNGFMKSAGVPPAPAAEPATADGSKPVTPTDKPAPTAPADGAATPAAPATAPATDTPTTPAKPAAAPVPTGPVSGDGVARVIVAIGGEASVTEWRDGSGSGAPRKLSKAVSYAAAASDLRDGGSIPVTVTVELNGGTAIDSSVKLNSVDLQLFTESAPLAPPPAAAGTPAPAADGATPAVPPTTDAPAAPATSAPAAPTPAAPTPAATPAPATPAAGGKTP